MRLSGQCLLQLPILEIDRSRGIRVIPQLNIIRSRPLELSTLTLSRRTYANVVPLQQLDQNRLDLIRRKESTGASPVAMTEDRAFSGSRHELVLVLLAGMFAQIAETPGVELVQGRLWGHGREIFGIECACLPGGGDGNNRVVGEVVTAGECDALWGGDEAGEHCFEKKEKERFYVSPRRTHAHKEREEKLTYLLLEGGFFGFP